MVIDDSDDDLLFARRLMESNNFADEIVEMKSATKALEYIRSNQGNCAKIPSLIFLNLNMPGIDGFAFLDAYQAIPTCLVEKASVFMMSAAVHPDDIARAQSHPHAKKYIVKALSRELLTAL